MATPYEKIYRRFLSKITDYDFLKFDQDTQYQYMHDLLVSACDDFEICKHNLQERDDIIMEFAEDLTSKEIEILAVGMVYHWIEPKVLDSSNLHNFLNTKDYTLSGSPANLLAQIKDARDQSLRRMTFLINQYSYRNGEMGELGK